MPSGRKRQTPQISLEWGLREFTRLRDRFLHRIARVKRRYRFQYRSNNCLSFPGTVRRNLRYGGTLLHLLYRSPLRRTPRILVLCDVSSSMLKHIVFTVSFSQILHHVIPQTKVFLCANGLEPMALGRLDVSSFLAKANELLGDSTQIGRGTNLGVSFDRLSQLMQEEGTRYTHLFIISDAETTEAPKAVEAMKRLRDSGLRILWLNPAPRRSWGENSFLSKARRYCSMRECIDFRQFVQWIRSGARI